MHGGGWLRQLHRWPYRPARHISLTDLLQTGRSRESFFPTVIHLAGGACLSGWTWGRRDGGGYGWVFVRLGSEIRNAGGFFAMRGRDGANGLRRTIRKGAISGGTMVWGAAARAGLRPGSVGIAVALVAAALFLVQPLARVGAAPVATGPVTPPALLTGTARPARVPAGLQRAIDGALAARPVTSPGGVRLSWGRRGAVTFGAAGGRAGSLMLRPLSIGRAAYRSFHLRPLCSAAGT